MHDLSIRRRPRPAVLAALAVLAAASVLGACSGDGADDDAATTTRPAVPTTGEVVELRPLGVEDQQIVDDQGRQVLLRGANVNALGEYAQADPATEPTAPVTDADWDAMAANGFSVVRLIMSWSLLEPERGAIDRDYLAKVRDAVADANARGIYVVLDVHQDAWGMSSATP
jgi:endoglycosylceramidase